MSESDIKDDDYLEDFILPESNDKVNTPEYIEKLESNEFKSNELCEKLRKTYIEQLVKKGYKNIKESDVFYGFPIDASKDKVLLGAYMFNLPICKYMQLSKKGGYVLKLNGNSLDHDLNFLSKILRQNIPFLSQKVYFVYNPVLPNKLELDYIVHEGVQIDESSELWLELLQSAYTELVLIIAIEHAFWHLIVAHIIWIAKRSLFFTEILKVFEMAEHDVFIKALEVKFLLFGTPFIFQQTLNNNKEFKKYMIDRISTFIDTFNIDTVYSTYFNIGFFRLGDDINWIPGMESNIKIIKKFVDSVISSKDISNENDKFVRYTKRKYSKFNFKNDISIKKFLEILFVVGTAFHSTTFEFTKLLFTDVFYNKKFNQSLYNISLQTIITNIDTVFGDLQLYKGKYYKDEVKNLHLDLEKSREKLFAEMAQNDVFRNNIFSNKETMLNTFSTNTYTTYV
jgi:hypothetical protein